MTDTHHTDHAPEDAGVTPDLLAQLENTLWLPHDLDETERGVRLAAARATLADIDPAPGIEAMLACQMVAAHEASMACLGRSMAPAAAPEMVDQNLKHAERLMALYARQTDVLGRHRAREQKRAQAQVEADRQQRKTNPQPMRIRRAIVEPDGLISEIIEPDGRVTYPTEPTYDNGARARADMCAARAAAIPGHQTGPDKTPQ